MLEGYLSTFLERDIPQFGLRVPAASLRRFWIMLSHYHGNIRPPDPEDLGLIPFRILRRICVEGKSISA